MERVFTCVGESDYLGKVGHQLLPIRLLVDCFIV